MSPASFRDDETLEETFSPKPEESFSPLVEKIFRNKPSAGDLYLAAVEAWMEHGPQCQVDPCATCDVLVNQMRLARKVYQNSAHKTVTWRATSGDERAAARGYSRRGFKPSGRNDRQIGRNGRRVMTDDANAETKVASVEAGGRNLTINEGGIHATDCASTMTATPMRKCNCPSSAVEAGRSALLAAAPAPETELEQIDRLAADMLHRCELDHSGLGMPWSGLCDACALRLARAAYNARRVQQERGHSCRRRSRC